MIPRALAVLLSIVAVAAAIAVMWTSSGREPAPTAAPQDSAVSLEEQLMAADREFAADTAARGIEGWMAWMAPDAARTPQIGGPLVAGSDAIRALDAPNFERTDLQLVWEPLAAHAYDGGNLGLTTGRYEIVTVPEGTVRGAGNYVSVWRRGPDGWRVIFDTGAPEGPPAGTPPGGPGSSAGAAPQ